MAGLDATELTRVEVIMIAYTVSASRWLRLVDTLRSPDMWPDDIESFLVKMARGVETDIRAATQTALEAHARPHGSLWSARFAQDQLLADIQAETRLAVSVWNRSAYIEDSQRKRVIMPLMQQHIQKILGYERSILNVYRQLEEITHAVAREHRSLQASASIDS